MDSFGVLTTVALMFLTEQVIEQKPGFLRVAFPEVDCQYKLTCDWLLVQASGECCGVAFYFRAKYGEWEFETQDERGGPFPTCDSRYFILRDCYDKNKPGAMGLEWAARILRRCIEKWALRFF